MLRDRVSQRVDATFDAKQTKCGIFTCAPLCGRRTARGISESVFAFSPGAICSECTLSPPRSLRDWLHERERECAPRRYTIYFSRQPPMACDDALLYNINSLFAANPRTAFAFSFIAPEDNFLIFQIWGETRVVRCRELSKNEAADNWEFAGCAQTGSEMIGLASMAFAFSLL